MIYFCKSLNTGKTAHYLVEVVSMNNYIRSKISSRDTALCFIPIKGSWSYNSLTQVAYTLAAQGKNIVLIDFDIEAPSFHLLLEVDR